MNALPFKNTVTLLLPLNHPSPPITLGHDVSPLIITQLIHHHQAAKQKYENNHSFEMNAHLSSGRGMCTNFSSHLFFPIKIIIYPSFKSLQNTNSYIFWCILHVFLTTAFLYCTNKLTYVQCKTGRILFLTVPTQGSLCKCLDTSQYSPLMHPVSEAPDNTQIWFSEFLCTPSHSLLHCLFVNQCQEIKLISLPQKKRDNLMLGCELIIGRIETQNLTFLVRYKLKEVLSCKHTFCTFGGEGLQLSFPGDLERGLPLALPSPGGKM